MWFLRLNASPRLDGSVIHAPRDTAQPLSALQVLSVRAMDPEWSVSRSEWRWR